tara:strand:- start:781 stop:5070 length:4290 start_codon:yes stop_codon:yes gene_type:complete
MDPEELEESKENAGTPASLLEKLNQNFDSNAAQEVLNTLDSNARELEENSSEPATVSPEKPKKNKTPDWDPPEDQSKLRTVWDWTLGVQRDKDLPEGAFYRKGHGDKIFRARTDSEILDLLKGLGTGDKKTWQEFRKSGADEFASTSGDVSNPLKGFTGISRYGAAMGAGWTDSMIGLVNLALKPLPGDTKIPTLPKYESESLQAVRDLSSLVIPGLQLSKYGKLGWGKVVDKTKWGFGKRKIVGWGAGAGITTTAGWLVDTAAPSNYEDHNLQGMLKKNWPRFWGWLPEDWATLDGDSRELKMIKNRNEGIGLNWIGELLDATLIIGRLTRGIDTATKTTRIVSEDTQSLKYMNNIKAEREVLSENVVENDLLNNKLRKEKQRKLYGEEVLKDNPNTTKPIQGLQDSLIDPAEQGILYKSEYGMAESAVDAARRELNVDSGLSKRIANGIDEADLKSSLRSPEQAKRVFQKAKEELLKAGKFGFVTPKGKTLLNSKQIGDVGRKLAADLYDLDVDGMADILRPLSGLDINTGARVLKDEAYVAVFENIRKYLDDYLNLDLAKAQALLADSISGQVSDLAEGARLMEDTLAMSRAQDLILDRLEFLMTLKGQTSYARGRGLAMLGWLKRWATTATNMTKFGSETARFDFEAALAALTEQNSTVLDDLAEISAEAKRTIDTLREVKAERPHFLKPLALAYEMTDGNIKNIADLNNYVRNSTGVIRKAFIDGQPEVPSMWVQGAWATIYNSVLSGLGTPLKAFAANTVLLVERPLATYAGAMLTGDMHTLRRAQYMYNYGFLDSIQKSFSHMAQIMRRSWQDPNSIRYVLRDDIARKNANQIKLNKEIGKAMEEEGDYALSTFMNDVIEPMNDFGEHPWMRFSANAMGAYDGFTRSMVAAAEARGRVFDELVNIGDEFTDDVFNKTWKGVYDEMFDDNGFIVDKAVDNASREIAMNANSKTMDGVNAVMKRAPVLRAWFMFSKTTTNMIKFAGSHNPATVLPFINRVQKYRLPWEELVDSDEVLKRYNKGTEILNINDAKRTLAADGLDINKKGIDLRAEWNTRRAEMLGRKAIGTLAVVGAIGLFSQTAIRGNGIYDKTRQKVRDSLGYKKRTIKGWDGKWYSYDGIPGISDWLALTVDVLDNFDVGGDAFDLGGNYAGTLQEDTEMLSKLSWILATNLTNKSFTSQIEPLFDILSGNPSSIARWSASFGSGLLPFSGFRREQSQLWTKGMVEINQEFADLVAARNPGARNKLAPKYDWITGERIGEDVGFWERANNVYNFMMKTGPSITPEKEFLMGIEYDARPILKTLKGVKLTTDQRSEMMRIMGESGIFKRAIEREMRRHSSKEFRKLFREVNRGGVKTVNIREELLNTHNNLNVALRTAVKYALSQLSTRGEIYEQKSEAGQFKSRLRGITPGSDLDRIHELQRQ